MKINFNIATLPKFTGIRNKNTEKPQNSNIFDYCQYDNFTKKVEVNSLISKSRNEIQWTLDDFIADYESAIASIRESVIIPAIKQKAGIKDEVQNAVLLHSDSELAKQMFAYSTANEINAHYTNLSSDNFIQNVSAELEKAKERYLKTKERTLILLTDAETCLEERPENQKNIEQMRKWIEHSAEIPSDKNPNAYATTFFISDKDYKVSEHLDTFYGIPF